MKSARSKLCGRWEQTHQNLNLRAYYHWLIKESRRTYRKKRCYRRKSPSLPLQETPVIAVITLSLVGNSSSLVIYKLCLPVYEKPMWTKNFNLLSGLPSTEALQICSSVCNAPRMVSVVFVIGKLNDQCMGGVGGGGIRVRFKTSLCKIKQWFIRAGNNFCLLI